MLECVVNGDLRIRDGLILDRIEFPFPDSTTTTIARSDNTLLTGSFTALAWRLYEAIYGWSVMKPAVSSSTLGIPGMHLQQALGLSLPTG